MALMKGSQLATKLEKGLTGPVLIESEGSFFAIDGVKVERRGGYTIIRKSEDAEQVPKCAGCEQPILNPKKELVEDEEGGKYHIDCAPAQEEDDEG